MTWDPIRLPDLTGHVYAVTGATGGIGYFAAEQLASAGAEVVLVSRSAQKIGVAAAAIRGQAPRAVTGSVAFDLTSLASVREGAEQLAALPRLDGIFLNGGPMDLAARARTQDGLPLMTGAHTVANVALVAGLLSARTRADRDRPLRIVHTSTGFVQQFRTKVTDARATARTGIGAYVVAKTLTEVFAYELDRRVRAAGLPITSVVTRPGVGVDAKTPHRPGIRDATVPSRRNPFTPWAQGKDAAAWSGVRALADPDVVGGQLYGPRKVAGPPVRLTPSPHTSAPSPDVADRVWAGLEDLAGTQVRVPRV
ncbi:short-chain dehydrogenase/reductase SDR [Xylanimonas cellulosilytica DSM 15894]|uniref:Short-chain dehydrogenase/reductase SDR n=1 Tax=Xylanimonas cellulosilytica (strain DSM 15894 / JCM 12276 / CECT 5975 / KCTC 9989 / LMG 20990 / NBRC 107835 / XIL07) TaxID=446471 RepID=D1BWB3_XYLCX|nr:SDR family NAD(P)-dependent oxidoreductase [Xylanimonas cellulosilytica]ACZ31458.1 short-chain dehydrogenase/reductase SDR [Xylanimonas cellulosilytica DSM 15894]